MLMHKISVASEVIDSAEKAWNEDIPGLRNKDGPICNLVNDFYNVNIDNNLDVYYSPLKQRFANAIKHAQEEARQRKEKKQKENKRKGRLQANHKNGKNVSKMFKNKERKRPSEPKAPKVIGEHYIPKVKCAFILTLQRYNGCIVFAY